MSKRISRRTFAKLTGASAAAMLFPGCVSLKPDRKPNIIVIMCDDMGFSDLGCYGSEIATPNIDRLAQDGVRFSQFYNTARCCPSRASLLTGLYPHQTGIGFMMNDSGFPSYRGDLNKQCVTIAEVLKGAGYQTALSGKWHVTPPPPNPKHNWPLRRGFDKFFGTIRGAGNYFNPPSLAMDNTEIEPYGDTFYYTDAVTENAVGFIDFFAQKPFPFFLYTAYTAPHWPLHALPEDIEKYKDTYGIGWDKLRENRHKKQLEMGLLDENWHITERDSRVTEWEKAPYKEWEAHRMAVYAAMIDRMDKGIGKIVSKLKQLDMLDNTLILFLSDNGGCAEVLKKGARKYLTRDGRTLEWSGDNPAINPGSEETYMGYGIGWANASNTPFRLYKKQVHEGGIAAPLIAHWPSSIKNRGDITGQPGHIIDIMPTCLNAAGADYPQDYNGNKIIPVEGKSLLPVFEGKTRKEHKAMFWEHRGNCAVRQGEWKLVSVHKGKWELYNLEKDRTELNDLSEKYPEMVNELKSRYENWAARCGVMPFDKINTSKTGKK